jgi:Protein of unknown function (DUF5818)
MKKIFLSVAGVLLVFTVVPKQVFAKPPSPSTMQQEARPRTQTFTGTIRKTGGDFVLSDSANKISYTLDDAEKASRFEGKKVKVTGTVDMASNMIHVETIQEVA